MSPYGTETFPWGKLIDVIVLPSGTKVYKYNPTDYRPDKDVYKYYPVIFSEAYGATRIEYHVNHDPDNWNGTSYFSLDQAIIGDMITRRIGKHSFPLFKKIAELLGIYKDYRDDEYND